MKEWPEITTFMHFPNGHTNETIKTIRLSDEDGNDLTMESGLPITDFFYDSNCNLHVLVSNEYDLGKDPGPETECEMLKYSVCCQMAKCSIFTVDKSKKCWKHRSK